MQVLEKLGKIVKPRSENIGLGIAILLSFTSFLVVITFFTKATLPMANYITTNYGFGRVSFVEYASIAISSASLVTVVAILLQVRNQTRNIKVQEELAEKEAEYLENFEPRINLVRVYSSKIERDNIQAGEKFDFQLMALNTSQTTTVIEEVYIQEHRGIGVRLRGGPSSDEDRKYDGSVPVEANKPVYLYLEPDDNLTEKEAEKLSGNDYLTLVVRGEDFESEEQRIPLSG